VRVVTFGTYQRDYPRNAQARACLALAGAQVVERHVDAWGQRRDAWAAGLVTGLRLAVAEVRLAAGRVPAGDVLLVGYPGHADMPIAVRRAGGRPIVFDPLVSLHDTLVTDRGRFRPGSLAARAVLMLDRAAFRGADVVVADTAAHADFYADSFGLTRDRVQVCFVGAEDRLFTPRDEGPREFSAVFVGKLIPLHGLEVILAAARLAPEVPFRIVGSGQLSGLLAHAPANVQHVAWTPYEQLPAVLAGAGCALGIFGTSAKTARVIPNKVYQALACAVPLVTADTPAARELLTHDRDAVLVPPGDPAALAEAVQALAADGERARRIGTAGRVAYERQAAQPVLAERWRAILDDLTAA
jgi:glycosyltransferase involved in cell wall biosynthesis